VKKLIIILSLFVCNIALTAQTNDLSAEAFMANTQTIQNSISEKFKTQRLCPANSKFNPESHYRSNAEIYVSLTPVDYKLSHNDGNNVTTNDPEYFWQKP
jgi:hypothetical protein